MRFQIKDRRTISFLILGLILLYLDINFILKRQIISLNKINLKIKNLNQRIISTSKDIGRESELKIRLKDLKNESIQEQIIFEEEIPDLIDRISKLANKVNLKITKISPLKDLKGAPLLETSLGKFYPLSLSLELSSGYHQLGKFLNLLESAERFFKLEEISIIPDSIDLFHHKIKLTLQTPFIRR